MAMGSYEYMSDGSYRTNLESFEAFLDKGAAKGADLDAHDMLDFIIWMERKRGVVLSRDSFSIEWDGDWLTFMPEGGRTH